jgi:hypothetical protein
MLLFHKGGAFNDLDVSLKDIPISNWVSQADNQKTNLILAREFDFCWRNNFFRQEFEIWAMIAKPRSTHLSMPIDDITEGLNLKVQEDAVVLLALILGICHEEFKAFSSSDY